MAGKFLTADGGVQFKIRTATPPMKTRIGYKVFVLKNGKLYPPMVANEDREATPVGVWLDADANEHLIIDGKENIDAEYSYVEPWLRRYKVKSGGKGTQGGSGELAYRPGWHLGEIPMALQFDRENMDKPVLDEDGNPVFDKKGKQKFVKDLFPANFVWAEVECAADEDYQQESDERMWYNKYGKRLKNALHSMGGLNHVPENGLYMYRTNPDPNTDAWIITGAMKVNRILKPSEVDQMIRDAGRIPQERQKGAVTDADVEELSKNLGLTAGSTTSFRVVGPGISTSEMAMAQAIYEARVATSGFQVKEVLQDSMLGLRACYDAIEKSLGRKREVWEIPDDENAYTFENRMSSMNAIQQKQYETEFIKPLLKEVDKLTRGSNKQEREVKYADLVAYMMAKHGLERDRVMRDNEKLEVMEWAKKQDERLREEWILNEVKNGMSYAAAEAQAKNIVFEDGAKKLAKLEDKDYAGLRGLAKQYNAQKGTTHKTGSMDEVRAVAAMIESDYESANNTLELWDKINAATRVQLDKQKECGILSKDGYDKISTMYNYYIPLRGWAEDTADKMYGYIMENRHVREAVLKTAKGRSSVADDPIATIRVMGEHGISTCNRNLMKQALIGMTYW